jgi:hypothetical protein
MDFLRTTYENAVQKFLEDVITKISSIYCYFFSDQQKIDRACQIDNDETYPMIADGSPVTLFYKVSLNDLTF